MDDEVEDIVGDVKYTDSQKSVTTLAVYSPDFTDCSSDKNNSSGKETYVIGYDSDDSDKTFEIHKNESIINLHDKDASMNLKQDIIEIYKPLKSIDRSVCTSLQICNIIAEETYTQTSKTIIELAQNEINKPTENTTLETQTSFVSVKENKTTKYVIQTVRTNFNLNTNQIKDSQFTNENISEENNKKIKNLTNTNMLANSLEDKSSVIPKVETEEDIIHFIDDESKEHSENVESEIQYDNTSEYDTSKFESDIEDDSLMENEYCDDITKSRDDNSETSEMLHFVDNDVEELYNRLSNSPQLLSPILSVEPVVRNFGILTPLTEETVRKKESIVDISPSVETLTKLNEFNDKSTLFVNNSGVRVKILSNNDYRAEERKDFKLPPIHKNQSCPNSPQLNFLFSINTQKPIAKANTLPSLYENNSGKYYDRWEIGTKELASGENPHIHNRIDPMKPSKSPIHLPSIHIEGLKKNAKCKTKCLNLEQSPVNTPLDVISIQGKIEELKMNTRKARTKFSSRSASPTSATSPDETGIYDTAERGCDLLCSEILRRLRSSSWIEITETLEEIPKAFDKFWSVITENRIADLLRQVTVHIESPRTQVARAACKTLAEILKNTNYTKRPDFFEGLSTLLAKTGSYNRPVCREANVALDDIVCSVDVTHCITAICIYGVSHKSALVRCASARLLVVCCALAEGGRGVLRTRPPSVATARRQTLNSLAELLQDKNIETRKYAERLYTILRPLPNFEAYFLTDVDVELATKHMKKYDQLLNNSKTR